MPLGGIIEQGNVVSRNRDVDGNLIVRENQNSTADTRQYEVEFTNGEVTEITANVIAKRIYTKCDEYGNDMLLLNYFVDYRKMEQSLSFQYQQLTVNEKPFMKHSTSGWDICVLWKDESTTWEKLLDLKDCYPV